MYMYMYVKHLYMYFFNTCCIERNNRFKMPLLTNLPTSLMYMYICKGVCTEKTITIGITQQSNAYCTYKVPFANCALPSLFSTLLYMYMHVYLDYTKFCMYMGLISLPMYLIHVHVDPV